MISQEQKDRWVAGLRSGLYKQVKRILQQISGTEVSNCSLGVLADILDNTKWKSHTPSSNAISICSYWGQSKSMERLPVNVLSWDIQSQIIMMNDSGESFEDIATWIETNVICE